MPGHHSEKGQSRSSLDVLLSDEAQWDLKLSDIIRIGVAHLWWYVATVYAIKLGNNIILATRTLHSFIPFLLSVFTHYAMRLKPRASAPFDNCPAGCLFSRCVSRRILRSGISTLPLPNRNRPGSVSFSMSLTNPPCRGKRNPCFLRPNKLCSFK
jgi:hypothetical protein